MARAEKVALERIEYLYDLAKKKLDEHPNDSRRYIQMLRDLATKHNIVITEKKRTFCKNCNTILSGKTSSVRIRNKIRVITCTHCGQIKRLKI